MRATLSEVPTREFTSRTIDKMYRHAREGLRHPDVVSAARRIARRAPERDKYQIGQHLLQHVKDKIHFVNDPHGVELVGGIDWLKKAGWAGDCDEMSTYLLALAHSVGIDARFKTSALRQPNHWDHVYVVMRIPRQGWLGADPTVGRSYLGWEPPRALNSKVWEIPGGSLMGVSGMGQIWHTDYGDDYPNMSDARPWVPSYDLPVSYTRRRVRRALAAGTAPARIRAAFGRDVQLSDVLEDEDEIFGMSGHEGEVEIDPLFRSPIFRSPAPRSLTVYEPPIFRSPRPRGFSTPSALAGIFPDPTFRSPAPSSEMVFRQPSALGGAVEYSYPQPVLDHGADYPRVVESWDPDEMPVDDGMGALPVPADQLRRAIGPTEENDAVSAAARRLSVQSDPGGRARERGNSFNHVYPIEKAAPVVEARRKIAYDRLNRRRKMQDARQRWREKRFPIFIDKRTNQALPITGPDYQAALEAFRTDEVAVKARYRIFWKKQPAPTGVHEHRDGSQSVKVPGADMYLHRRPGRGTVAVSKTVRGTVRVEPLTSGSEVMASRLINRAKFSKARPKARWFKKPVFLLNRKAAEKSLGLDIARLKARESKLFAGGINSGLRIATTPGTPPPHPDDLVIELGEKEAIAKVLALEITPFISTRIRQDIAAGKYGVDDVREWAGKYAIEAASQILKPAVAAASVELWDDEADEPKRVDSNVVAIAGAPDKPSDFQIPSGVGPIYADEDAWDHDDIDWDLERLDRDVLYPYLNENGYNRPWKHQYQLRNLIQGQSEAWSPLNRLPETFVDQDAPPVRLYSEAEDLPPDTYVIQNVQERPRELLEAEFGLDDGMGDPWVGALIGTIGGAITQDMAMRQAQEAADEQRRHERRLADQQRAAAEAAAEAARAQAALLEQQALARSTAATTQAWAARPGARPGIVKATPFLLGGGVLLLAGAGFLFMRRR